MKEKVIINTDVAIGLPLHDVDDGLAIALALKSPELEVVGLTVSYGNADLKSAVRLTRRLLKTAGREDDVPVLVGAASLRDLDRETEASRFIVNTLDSEPGTVSLLSIAPLTNIAAAEKSHPGVMSKARRIVAMGGAVYGPMFGNPLFQAEFNFWKDPAAAAIFLRAARDLTIVPADLTTRVSFYREYLNRLRDADTRLSRFIYRDSRLWHAFMSRIMRKDGFPPHDPLAVMWMLKPEWFETKTESLRIVERGVLGGKLIRDRKGTPVNVVTHVDESKFLECLTERLCG